jgi:hypothetical protein
VIVKPVATRAAAIAPQQVRRDAAFIEKHVLSGIADRQPVPPLLTRRDDIRPALFVGVNGFF